MKHIRVSYFVSQISNLKLSKMTEKLTLNGNTVSDHPLMPLRHPKHHMRGISFHFAKKIQQKEKNSLGCVRMAPTRWRGGCKNMLEEGWSLIKEPSGITVWIVRDHNQSIFLTLKRTTQEEEEEEERIEDTRTVNSKHPSIHRIMKEGYLSYVGHWNNYYYCLL